MTDEQENHAFARSLSNAGLGSTLDPLYAEACELVRSTGNTRISHLQRVKRLSYNQAARLMEAMEIDGIVSPTDKFGIRTMMPNVQIEARPAFGASPSNAGLGSAKGEKC